jgi:hypothetical protein
MPSLYIDIEINVSRRRVWQVLVRKEQWMYWNTFLYDRDPGQPFVQGEEIFLSLRRVPGETETEFQPRITLVQPGNCLSWVSTIPGFVSESVFELQDIGSDRTKYTHRANFSGVLTRMILPFIRQEEQQGMRRMSRELKQYVENLYCASR